MQKQGRAVGRVPTKFVGIKGVRKITPEPVYNMEVEGNHNFAVSEGLIVHNCMDDTRYFVNTKRIAKEKRHAHLSRFA